MEFKEIQEVISKENILIFLVSMGVLVGFQLIQRWFKQKEYQKAMKSYSMKQKASTISRNSSANSSRQNTPRSPVGALHPFMQHSTPAMGGTPLGRAYGTPSSAAALQLPGLGYNSPFKNMGAANNNMAYADGQRNASLNQDSEQKSLKKSSSDSFVFKAPYPVLKDTPRPQMMHLSSSMSSGSVSKAFLPTTPSPLVSSVTLENSSLSVPMHVDNPMNNQPHWPKGRTTTRSSLLAKEIRAEDKDVGDNNDFDMKDQQENEKPIPKKVSSTKRIREDGGMISSPNARRKKNIKVRRKDVTDLQPPGSVRKSDVPVAVRRAAFERSSMYNRNAAVEVHSDLVSKRKANFDEDNSNGNQSLLHLEHNGLLPKDGFTWIGQDEQRGKRVKLDKDTIVKKRLEYFKSLGVEVPIPSGDAPAFNTTSSKVSTLSAEVPTTAVAFSPSAPRIKLRNTDLLSSSSARIPVSSTPKKSSITSTSLRKVQDEDDLDEITMKRLERDDSRAVQTASESGKGSMDEKKALEKKTVTFSVDSHSGPNESSDSKDAKPAASLFAPVASKDAKESITPAIDAKSLSSFTFGASPSAPLETKKSDTSAAAPLSFSFPSVSKSEATAVAEEKTATAFSLGQTSEAPSTSKETPATPSFSFNIPSASTEKKEPATASPALTFGTSPVKPGAIPVFSFGKPASDSTTAPVVVASAAAASPAPATNITKPDTEKAAPLFGAAAPSANAPDKLNGFTFGSAASATTEKPSAGGYSFGASSAPAPSLDKSTTGGSFDSSSTAAPSTTTTAGNIDPGFSFGSTLTPVATSSFDKPAAPGLTFGSTLASAPTATSSNPSTPGFNFGSTSVPVVSSSSDKSAASGFTFGTAASTTDKPSSGSEGFTFGAAPTTASSASVAQAAAGNASTGFNFGGSKSTAPAPAANTGTSGQFSFGAPAGQSSTSMLNFGTAQATQPTPATNPAPSFSFDKPARSAAAPAPSQSTTFGKFGAPTSTSAQPGTNSQAPSFSFGQPIATSTTPASTFGGFGQSASLQPQTNNTPSANQTSTPAFGGFGASGFKPAALTPSVPAFGAAPIPAFGGSNSTSTPAAPPFGSMPASGAANTFSFGQQSSATPVSTASNTNAFGTAPTAAAGGAPSFQFGSSAPAPASSGFTFGGGSNTGTPSLPAFGASQPGPSLQQPPSFQFGSGGGVTSVPFGGNASAAPTPSQPPAFQFGGGATASPSVAPSSFNFGGAAPAAAPTFNAMPVQQIPPGRPILQPKFKGNRGGPKGRR